MEILICIYCKILKSSGNIDTFKKGDELTKNLASSKMIQGSKNTKIFLNLSAAVLARA